MVVGPPQEQAEPDDDGPRHDAEADAPGVDLPHDDHAAMLPSRRRVAVDRARCCLDGSRTVIAASCAGKPSCRASATTDGVTRRRAPWSIDATAVRLRNVCAVTPLETFANPLVGSDAGQPST